jgi:hypothetical protein
MADVTVGDAAGMQNDASEDAPGHSTSDAGGDVANPPPDASLDAPPDAPADATDAADAAGGPGIVTVHVGNALGAPESGVVVFFSDASGALLSQATTVPGGDAAAVVSAGSQATALLGGAMSGYELVTFVGVEPGDTLAVVDIWNTPDLDVKVTAVPPSPPAGTGSYAVSLGDSTGASFASPPGEVLASPTLGTDSFDPAGFSVLLVAQDGASSVLGYASAKGGPFLPDAGSSVSVAVGGNWMTSYGSVRVNAAGSAAQEPIGLTPYLDEISGGSSMYANSVSDVVVPDAGPFGTNTDTFATHLGYADSFQAGISIYNPTTAQLVVKQVSAPAAAAGISLDAAQMLPVLTAVTLDASDVARPAMSWTSASPLSSIDGTFAQLAWKTPPDSGAPLTGLWTFVVPPAASSLKAPVLPASAAAWAPAPGAIFSGPSSYSPSVVAEETDLAPNYAAFRRLASALLPKTGIFPTAAQLPPILPADGTLRISAYWYWGP